jgi:hypothetical protein
VNQACRFGNSVSICGTEEDVLREALTAVEARTPFPPFPISGPPTGYEGKPLESMPGHRMVYSDDFGMEGVEIETPEGMRISFSNREALERFIREIHLSTADAAALRAIDARADLPRAAGQVCRLEHAIN